MSLLVSDACKNVCVQNPSSSHLLQLRCFAGGLRTAGEANETSGLQLYQLWKKSAELGEPQRHADEKRKDVERIVTEAL